MIVFLNGKFLPEEEALISVSDRGFLYGDGLFETMRVAHGSPFRWAQHWQRLKSGAAFLGIQLNWSEVELRDWTIQLIQQNQLTEALVRIVVSRGPGLRGYSPKGANSPTTAISMHAAVAVDPANPPQWQLVTASPRLPANEAVAQYKTCNKLAQVLARAEADTANAQEALLLNTRGRVVEGASSNLFWIRGQEVCTSPLASGVLAGVTRTVVAELCAEGSLAFRETEIDSGQLRGMDAVFLSLSSIGIAEAVSLDGHELCRSLLVRRLSEAYWEKVRTDCLDPAIKSPSIG